MTRLMARLTQIGHNTWILKFVGEEDSQPDKGPFFTWVIDEPANGQPRPLQVTGKELTLDLADLESPDSAGVKLSFTIQHAAGDDQPQTSPATPLAQVTLLGGWLPSANPNGSAPSTLCYPLYIPEIGQTLTRREVQILALLAAGATNRTIAGQLVVSRDTVKTHLKNIFIKLGVASRAQATTRARELGLL